FVARIFAGREGHGFAVRRPHHGGPVGTSVGDRAGALVEDHEALILLVLDVLADDRDGFAADVAEIRRHAPVIVLAPLLVRVMVALGAGHADAEEKLGGVVDELLGLLQIAIPDRRRRFRLVADRREDFAGELIVRLVLGNALADPVVE